MRIFNGSNPSYYGQTFYNYGTSKSVTLSQSGRYSVIVWSCLGTGHCSQSATQTSADFVVKPAVPSQLSVAGNPGTKEVNLSWRQESNVDQYSVWSSHSGWHAVSSGSFSETVSALDTHYTYKVRAINSFGVASKQTEASISFYLAEPKTTAFEYDALGRLRKVIRDGGKSTEYNYDAAGNRESIVVE